MTWLVLSAGYAFLELLATLDWVQVAQSQGLRFSAPLKGNGFRKRLRGEIHGFAVDIRRVVPGAALEVRGPDPGFGLSRLTGTSRARKPDVGTGDPDFDARVRIEGNRTRALALLDQPTRDLARRFVSVENGKIRDGKLSAKLMDFASACRALDVALELADRLRSRDREPVPVLLRQAATSDPSGGVRLQALQELAAEFPTSAEVLRAAKDILGDPANQLPLVLLAARLALEPSSKAGRALRTKAVRRLLEAAPGDDPELAAELVQAQRQLRSPEAQARWLEMLASAQAEVRVAAAEALGELGDRRALPALERAASGLVLGRGQVKQAAQQAIEAIRRRHGGTQSGEISLVPVAALDGAVSRADEPGDDTEHEPEGGEVSLAD